MSRTLHHIDISITLESPYLVHGNDSGRFGLDATLLFDHLDRPILPGTLLAGRIAEVWLTYGISFGNANPDHWFGKPEDESTDAQRRSRLMVSDLVLTPTFDRTSKAFEIARTALDDTTGSVKHGDLLITEQISQPGLPLVFKGCWQVWADPSEVKLLAQQIRAALLTQTQLGAYRGIGFGRLLGCTVAAAPAAPLHPTLTLQTTSERIRLGLTLDAPICVNSTSRRGNVFISDDTISGGILLGALAQTLLHQHQASHLADIKDSLLAKHFDALRCTHAFPCALNEARPMPLPQSLVATKEGESDCIWDAFQHASSPPQANAPAFQTDWKDEVFEKVGELQGWRQTLRHLRVRTAMKDGKAHESKLFAYDCVFAPLTTDGQPSVQWQFDLDLQAVPDSNRGALLNELTALLRFGLAPIGKTDATAQVQQIHTPRDVWPSRLDRLTGLVQLVLTSDALLFPTDAIADKTELDLTGLYRKAFDDLAAQAGLSDALSLSHIFARQRLSGGKYMQLRFLHTKGYQPLVLTQAGSVFVFKILAADKAKSLLTLWHSRGLPLPNDVKSRHGSTWQNHPYIPQNGYGEVAINPQHSFQPLLRQS